MKSIARYACLFGLCVLLSESPIGELNAQEQIAWVADVQTASAMAADQRRLVLLHFYSDNCGPCVALERNVFNQANVAHALAQNYIAVKVHAGKNPQLAARYRVNRWPTDVFVTPSGLEVYRTISPDNPGDYVAVLNQVALQTGIGTSRQWQSPLDQVVRPAAAEAALEAQKATQALNSAAAQMQQSVAHGQQAASHYQQQAADLSQRGIATANQWSQDAISAAHRYGQQAQQAQQQVRQEADQVQRQVQNNFEASRHDLSQAARQAAEQFNHTTQQTSQQLQQTAQGFGQQLQQAIAAPANLDRRSAFQPPGDAGSAVVAAAGVPFYGSAGASPSQAGAASPQMGASPSQAVGSSFQPAPSSNEIASSQAQAAAAPHQAASPVPANNPWVSPSSSAPPLVAPAPAANREVASTSPPPVAANAQAPAHEQLVPASQAPPIGLDGFCPVTLVETMAREPNSRSAWKKGDKQFGAIHRGRTYLFASAEHQQRFLANPDTYAPALAGCDPVRFAERGEMVDGKRAYGLITPDRRIYLFADEASRNRFEQSPAAYSNAIQQAMLRSEAGGVYR